MFLGTIVIRTNRMSSSSILQRTVTTTILMYSSRKGRNLYWREQLETHFRK